MRKIKVAVIGIGHLGKVHAEKLANFSEVELKALVDIDLNKAKEVANYLKIKYQIEPEVFSDFRSLLLLKNNIDAVVIATPTVTHYEIAKEFLFQRKAIFLEKPIAHSWEHSVELVELSEKMKVPLQVGYIERFQEPVKLLIKKVQNPLFIEAHRLSSFVERNLDVDVVLDLMIHDLDLALYLKKYPRIKMVHAVGAPLFSDHPDIVNARIVFEDETTANFTASRVSLKKERRFRVFEKGIYYVVDTLEKSFLEIKVNFQKKEFISFKKEFPDSDPLKEELESFVKSLINKEKVKIPGREALEALRLAFLIKSSVEENLRKLK